ncbi:MAG: HD domain-containing protein [Actinomycetota bacterium]
MDESDLGAPSVAPTAPAWIAESQLLSRAYRLAASAHASQHRATDGAPFLDHVVEVATFLHDAGVDEELVTAGLLHDAVERGTLTEERLKREMGDPVTSLVLSLTEDSSIESFAERKAALREQVMVSGPQAITIFAADKLSDISGLRRGIDRFGDEIEKRMGTTVEGMASHYRESVEMIESSRPRSAFVPDLHAQLDELDRYAAARR